MIEGSFADGFDWCIEKIKASVFNRLAAELEIHKALEFLKMKEFKKAVKLLKAFEKKDSELLSTAATNLAFLYFLVWESRELICWVLLTSSLHRSRTMSKLKRMLTGPSRPTSTTPTVRILPSPAAAVPDLRGCHLQLWSTRATA